MDGDEEQMLMAIDRFGNVTANGGLYAQQYTTIQGMIIRSDARLKNVIGVSNGASDLQKIRAMEITDYTLRNDKVEPPKPYKMLIAQQVESIYPQAISFDKGLVPDIMLPSQALSFQEDEITVTLGQAHDIAVGDRVVLQTGKKGIPVEVVSVPSLGSFVARGWEGEPVSEVLVYGREVDDLRSVNYDAISMLNVSATQELARKVERLDSVKEEVASLRAENERLRQQVADLEGLRQQVADLEALRQEVNDLDELRQEMAALREVCSQRSENACDVQP
jgi:regulator of replication initiation timing